MSGGIPLGAKIAGAASASFAVAREDTPKNPNGAQLGSLKMGRWSVN